jgi:hypothetical protein
MNHTRVPIDPPPRGVPGPLCGPTRLDARAWMQATAVPTAMLNPQGWNW